MSEKHAETFAATMVWLADKLAAKGETGQSCLDRAAAVSDTVAELSEDQAIISAAALFPAISSGCLSRDQVEAKFGVSVASLADQLVKLDRTRIPGDIPEHGGLGGDQAEALRKMLLTVVSDVRLVLVRLADQLYQMRTLKNSPVAEQRRAATETRIVFAPLANRLGIWQLKWELEDLAFRYLEPEHYRRIARDLRERRKDRETYIGRIQTLLHKELEKVGVRAEISGRPKHIYSIWRKMQCKNLAFEQVFDIRAIRIMVDSVADCYAALGIVHGIWPYIQGEFDDYITTPKENLYQSLHTAVNGPHGKPLEIQIRTAEMHQHAELGVAAHWQYKEGGKRDSAFEQKVVWLRRLLEPVKNDTSDEDFLSRVQSEIFEDRIYVISPRGDVVDLPMGGTPLDFAYHIHTDIGHCCRGAKVNGKMVPLTYKLANGQQVEILTGKEPSPSRDWLITQLGFLASSRARVKVRSWFRRQDKEQNLRQGRAMLDRELSRLGYKKFEHEKLSRLLHFGTPDEMYIALGTSEITVMAVAGAIQRFEQPAEKFTPKARKTQPSTRTGKGKVSIQGVGDLMTGFGRCCQPVPPEQIRGYLTQGRGVTIHRDDCGNLLRLLAKRPERVLDVSWTSTEEDLYPASISVRAYDRAGLVKDVTTLLADEKIRIFSLDTLTDSVHNTAEIRLGIEVSGLDKLSRVLHRLTSLANVVSAKRNP
ncbi:MAG: bifunctional (p)ppGpp synthetase/guanosine-3',5'-bis(diphosphate) 3'-pyrophosphohydrolase [Gammaproteobacteria bacterium]|nr:bifunctional (p)ppGpp synthetase/guanosine-3',5'-bis(diphosphate) 3'-pyrophosphohydrolase [Gammaproteobacteria bacterium]